tara:strand:+ start:637 stop:870 length:234 start_codon:yes stop_codon:yes gene_type:complete
MTNTKSNKKPSVILATLIVTPNTKLTYVNKNGAEHNINRAKKVGGYTYANALAYYKSIGYGKTDLNYDIRGGRLIVS